MATIPEALEIAIEHHQRGRLPHAAQIYRQILAVDPNHVDALHLLAVAACQTGRHAIGVEHMERAISLRATDATIHANLGNAYCEMRNFEKAAASYLRALEINPDSVEARTNLGTTFKELGRIEEAIECFRQALVRKPEFALYYNLGNLLSDQNKYDDAVDCYRAAIELKNDHVDAFINLALVLKEQQKHNDAIAACLQAIACKPDSVEAYNVLGVIWRDQGELDKAAECYQRALQLKPDFADAHNKLGAIYGEQGKFEEAANSCRRAIELDPQLPEAHHNLGNALMFQRKLDEAIASYHRELERWPDSAQAHTNLALTLLLMGDWEQGWPKHEWRWRLKNSSPRPFAQPLWDGTSLRGKTILLHADQALGDTIQFIRYAPMVKTMGATVVVECQQSLLPLLANSPDVDRWIGRGNDLPPFDVHAPLMSLPAIVKTTLDSIPGNVPYIHPLPALVEKWRAHLSELKGLRIGINWQGNPKFYPDRLRSIPLTFFTQLGKLPNVHFVSLQKRAGAEQLREVDAEFPVHVLPDDFDTQAGAFMDTAAIMKNLDLVISSDTSIAHLAGALGVPIWVALSFVPDWRWLLDRNDSPWYPTMRLFRQSSPGDWKSVFNDIRVALVEQLQGGKV